MAHEPWLAISWIGKKFWEISRGFLGGVVVVVYNFVVDLMIIVIPFFPLLPSCKRRRSCSTQQNFTRNLIPRSLIVELWSQLETLHLSKARARLVAMFSSDRWVASFIYPYVKLSMLSKMIWFMKAIINTKFNKKKLITQPGKYAVTLGRPPHSWAILRTCRHLRRQSSLFLSHASSETQFIIYPNFFKVLCHLLLTPSTTA